MSDKLFKVPADWAKNSYVNQSSYEAKYKESVNNNEKFWADEGKRIHWFKPYTKIKEVIYSTKKVSIKWFHDGTTNVSYNCIDRHLPKRAKQTAIIFEGDDPKESKNITYQKLSDEVCKLANGLKEIGIRARADIERALVAKIFLGLHIKVSKEWQRDARMLDKLGFEERR